MQPKISLIVPVYNVEKYLKKCLESAINQTLKEIEIIVVNDGSTDNSLSISEEYAKSDNRITIITQDNAGLSAARNTGLKVAKGDYIAFLDSDDYIETTMLKTMFDKAIDESSDIVMCNFNRIDENGKSLDRSYISGNVGKEALFIRLLAAKYFSVAWSNIYKRELFLQFNISYPVGLYHEDVPTTYKLFYHAKNISVVEDVFYHWLQRKGSISKSMTQKHIDDTFNIYQLTKDFLIDKDIFSVYSRYYIRRVFHFTVGLIEKINYYSKDEIEKHNKVFYIIQKMKTDGYETAETLDILKDYDPNLYKKYINTINPGCNIKLQQSNKQLKAKKSELNKIRNSKGYKLLQKLYKIKDQLISKNNTQNDNTSSKDFKLQSNEITKITTLKNRYKGERCFIIGNGPSLNKLDLTFLKDEYTFGVNGIFYKTEEMGFKPTFYMVEDNHVVDDNIKEINKYDIKYKFFPSIYKDRISATDNTYFFNADLGFYRTSHPYYCIPRFSKDFSKVSYAGQSVTYMNMQLAYYLGFSEVYLIGMDFSYAIRESDEADGATLLSNEDDINHFHPDYFGKGKKWHDPKVERVGWNYAYARKMFEEDQRNIYNATAGGKLEIFERRDYDKLFK